MRASRRALIASSYKSLKPRRAEINEIIDRLNVVVCFGRERESLRSEGDPHFRPLVCGLSFASIFTTKFAPTVQPKETESPWAS